MVLQILWRVNSPFAPTFSIIAYDFIVINSSLNFIIYVLSAPRFRYVIWYDPIGINSLEGSHRLFFH